MSCSSRVPNLSQRVRAEGEQFANVSSGRITMDQWLDLSRRINDRFKKDADLAGVVVTSGTDTLEELAYFLHLTVRDPRPVVVVGSMRNPSQTGYEGVANLDDGFRVAADPASRDMGTLVVLNDQINSAREVTKNDAQAAEHLRVRRLWRARDRLRPRGVRPQARQAAHRQERVRRRGHHALPRVDVILTYQGANGDLIKAAADLGRKGIVTAGAGAGALSGSQGQGVSQATEKGVFVVSTTRTGAGSVGTGGRGGASRRIQGDDLQPSQGAHPLDARARDDLRPSRNSTNVPGVPDFRREKRGKSRVKGAGSSE